jgi:DNA-binding HxlR family transcriptional regulator
MAREDGMRKQRHQQYTNCPVEAALDIIGGKWKSILLFRVLEETRRFSELEKLLPKITRRILTTQLRELERDGLVKRTVFAEVPPRVEYSITDLGRSLQPVLVELKKWAETHMPARMQGLAEENASTEDAEQPAATLIE